jgi:hypothetical protein
VQSDNLSVSDREVSARAVMSGHRRMELTLLCSGRKWADELERVETESVYSRPLKAIPRLERGCGAGVKTAQ